METFPGKISVIMGIYNCADTLPDAVGSIIVQTYTDWELIMCDDASTDGTYAVAEKFAKEYPDKIVLLKNDKNSKLSFTLNHCLEHASGEYVARMDADDRCIPTRFEEQVGFLKAHPEFQLVGSTMQRFDQNGTADVVGAVEYPDKYTLRYHTPFNHATIMTYKSVYDCLGGYTVSERTVRGQDYDLWFRFYHAGYNGYNIQKSLYLVKEDMGAIKRRTFRSRWNIYKTTKYGFGLLGFPKRWLIRPFFTTIFKSLVPYSLIGWYRKLQKGRVRS